MASSSLTLYSSNSTSQAFALVSSSVDKTVWKVAGRPLSTPIELEFTRRLTNGSKNDHLVLRLSQKEQNASTAQLATGQILVDISVPKDQSIITPAVLVGLLGMVSSLLNDASALATTSANRTAIVDGRDV